jgi:predicted transcriptional regulator
MKMALHEKNVRELILREFCKNPSLSTLELAKSCQTTRRTVQRTLKKIKQGESIDRKRREGQPTRKSNVKLQRKVCKLFEKNPSISSRDVAKKVKTSQSNVQKIKNDCCIKTYKKQKAPKRTAEQYNRAVRRSRLLYALLVQKKCCLIIDDETYVKADFKSLPGNQYYSARDISNLDESKKVIAVEKFAKKYLVWQAICQCGSRSSPFITTGTINTDIYISECLKKRLLPFMKKHTSSTLFWPDLASCHYSTRTLEWYKANSVEVVPKESNPPNCPELRPIEKYWANIKSKLRKTCQPATSLPDFQRKWIKCTKLVTDDSVQRSMNHIKSKVREFSRRSLKEP